MCSDRGPILNKVYRFDNQPESFWLGVARRRDVNIGIEFVTDLDNPCVRIAQRRSDGTNGNQYCDRSDH